MKLDGLWSGGRRRTHARQRHDEGAYQRCFDHHVTRWSGSAAWPQVAQYLGSTSISVVMGSKQGSRQPALHLTREQKENIVPVMFWPSREGTPMIRAVVEEVTVLASLALFMGMIAVWGPVIAVL